MYEDGEWVGALASPNQATQTSETTYQTATRSAAQVANLSDDNHALTSLLTSFDTAVSELTAPHLALSHTLPSSSLSPTAPSLPSPTANTAPQPAKSTVPAISVILGGILQLATGSYALYESYFKNHV